MVPWHAASAAWLRVTVLCAAFLSAYGFLTAYVKAPSQRLTPHTTTRQSVLPPLSALQASGKDILDSFIAGATFAINTLPGPVKAGLEAIGGANSTARAVGFLHSSTLPLHEELQGDKLVKRDCVADFKSLVDRARVDERNPTLLVYGPRGAGKTSVVATALQDTTGVLYTSYHGDGRDLAVCLEHAMLQLAELPITGSTAVEPGNRLRAIFAVYKIVHKCRPLAIIDINEKVESATLSALLLQAKQLGCEEKLATFIFVVSASRSALGLTIGLRQSRVRGYHAPDFNTIKAHNFLAKHLRPSPELAEFVVQQVGTRVMDLVEVCSECSGAESEVECRKQVEAYREECIDDAEYALRGFVAIAKRNAAATSNEDARLAFFKKLQAGTPVLKDKDAEMAFGFDEPALLLLALAEYHAFAIDLFGHRISMQSYFMQTAIEQYLQAAASNAAGTSEPSSA